ncbi:MAG TPA: hypothetical protein VLN46_05325 [Gillisia sp.]|nr:hypothetical protein [Gillisia sp.]
MKIDKRDSAEIRKIIMETLVEIKNKVSLDFDIKIEADSRFGENIILTLAPEPTEIDKIDGNPDEKFEKAGARIVFHQIFSNGSEVSYQMSYIPGLADEPKTELKDMVPRQTINRQYIMEKVLAFLEEVSESEN